MPRAHYLAFVVSTAASALAACQPESSQNDPTAAMPASSTAAPASTSESDVPGTTAREAIDAAIEALGGLDRISGVRNITMLGYGQYAYQNGGGNVTGLPDAPQKYIAANDMRRIYDLEHDRYYQQERRNDLFPFAAYGGHSFALNRQILDGETPYALDAEGNAIRRGDVRDLLMWMHANPIVAVRAALDPANTLGNRRDEDGLSLVDVTLRQGYVLTLAIRPPANRPEWIRWIAPDQNLGQVALTTHFLGYVPFHGVELPMGYTTRSDWRNVDRLKIYVDGYHVDADIQDLTAPAQISPAPPGFNAGPIEVTPVARGLWRITGGTMVIEFSDHMTLFEAGGSRERVREVVAAARAIVPDKPVTQLIQSHHHFDHTAGLRQAVAEGLTIISRRDNGLIFEEMTSRPAPDFPDDLERSGRTLSFMPVDDHLRLEDDTMTLDIYHVIANNHMADAVFAHIPEHRIMIEADVATAAVDLQWWGDSWLDNIAHRGIDVETNVPVHMTVMSRQEVLDMVGPGIGRVKEWCARHEAAGNYFPGCPAFLR